MANTEHGFARKEGGRSFSGDVLAADLFVPVSRSPVLSFYAFILFPFDAQYAKNLTPTADVRFFAV